MDDIYYEALVNKLLWEHGVYHVFNKIDEESKHQIIVKGSIIAKQQQFNKVNFKAMKLEIQLAQREVPQVDEEATRRKRQRRPCILFALQIVSTR